MNQIEWIALIAASLRLATPLVFASLGGLYSERSGIINIALDGVMLIGAFIAAVVNLKTGNPWVGMLFGATAGVVAMSLYGFVVMKFHADQVVVGTAINILAYGIPPLLSKNWFGSTGSTPSIPLENQLGVWEIPVLDSIPILGPLFSGHSPFVYLSWVAVAITSFVIFKTPFGLRLRAVGEHPEAAATSGISVVKMRAAAIVLAGFLAGMGGAFLSIGHGSLYARNMTAGRGFIALAALIFGRWLPWPAFAACLLFGFADALQIQLQGVSIPGWGRVPVQLIQVLPYVITIFALASWGGRSRAPAALGKPYQK